MTPARGATPVHRVLDEADVPTLDAYRELGGGEAIEAVRRLGPAAVIEEIEASGLRGRGGAGFPTGVKWRTVAEAISPAIPAMVVVNAAEGEPGSFKDRAILRRNPYRVLEGAIAAAITIGADRVVVAVKASFGQEVQRLRAAMDEIRGTGWVDDIELSVVEGPSEYLYGEETALLEVVAGRRPFPRIAPPFRHGADEVTSGGSPETQEPSAETASTAEVELASPEDETLAPPALVNNVETMANVALVLAKGPAWFREMGTAESPGTIVCTVTGHTVRHGVAEFPMGTPLRDVIEAIGGGPDGDRIVAVLSGVAHPLVPATELDTPLTYEAMEGIGSGLGAAGFIVFDDTVDLVAVAHGVSHFLAVESCGQCTPCKQDGLLIAELLDRLRRSEGSEHDVMAVDDRLSTVIVGARCYLAHQQQRVVDSLLRLFREHVDARVEPGAEPAGTELIAPIVDLAGHRAVLDDRQREKQPDWSYGGTWSGQSPADRTDQRLSD